MVPVATAPTVYGIETLDYNKLILLKLGMLQQHLPFTVLKLVQARLLHCRTPLRLQQHLPFTVLKPVSYMAAHLTSHCIVATAPTVYGIETWDITPSLIHHV